MIMPVTSCQDLDQVNVCTHMYHGILFGNKKEGNLAFSNDDIDDLEVIIMLSDYVRQKKSKTYIFTYMWNLKNAKFIEIAEW